MPDLVTVLGSETAAVDLPTISLAKFTRLVEEAEAEFYGRRMDRRGWEGEK
jgi:hypothetical protein